VNVDEKHARILDAMAIVSLIVIWAITLFALPGLPDSIASSRRPGSADSKYLLLALPTITLVIWGIIEWRLRSSDMRINMPFEIPDEQLPCILDLTKAVSHLLRAEILIGFAALQWQIIGVVSAPKIQAGVPTVVGAMLLIILGTVVRYTYRIWQIAKRSDA
jgi:hypothetical protein